MQLLYSHIERGTIHTFLPNPLIIKNNLSTFAVLKISLG